MISLLPLNFNTVYCFNPIACIRKHKGVNLMDAHLMDFQCNRVSI